MRLWIRNRTHMRCMALCRFRKCSSGWVTSSPVLPRLIDTGRISIHPIYATARDQSRIALRRGMNLPERLPVADHPPSRHFAKEVRPITFVWGRRPLQLACPVFRHDACHLPLTPSLAPQHHLQRYPCLNRQLSDLRRSQRLHSAPSHCTLQGCTVLSVCAIEAEIFILTCNTSNDILFIVLSSRN